MLSMIEFYKKIEFKIIVFTCITRINISKLESNRVTATYVEFGLIFDTSLRI